MKLTSSAFSHNDAIPRIHTCEGRDISPPLQWSDAPSGTRGFVLVVDDPDVPTPGAPRMTWTHWVLYNLPADCKGLPQDARQLPTGTRDGRNDWQRTGYGGPCPPTGRHRYFHKLYALDVVLPDLKQPTRNELEKAMHGHVLGTAELVGTYQKGTRE